MDSLHWSERFRNVVGIVRDVSLLGVLLGLLAFPATVRAQLSEAGIVKGSIFGIDFETELKESKAKSEDALADTKSAQKELGQAVTALAAVNRKITELEARNPELAGETEPLRDQLKDSVATASAAKDSIDETVTKQQAVVANQAVLIRRFQVVAAKQ